MSKITAQHHIQMTIEKSNEAAHRTISRRDVLLAGAASAAGLMSGALRAADLLSKRKPNIIYIMADDLGVADIGCYGAPEIKTPAIDSMARDGMRFAQAYANSAVCTATRVALITGRYQYRLRVGLWEPLAGPGAENDGLAPEHPTLPSLLKKAGYESWLIGKWHLGDLPKYGPLQSGYDHFYGFRGGALDYFSHKREGKAADFWEDDTMIERKGYFTDLLGERTVEVIKSRKQDSPPFFISLHFNAPHWPWEGPGDEHLLEKYSSTDLHREIGKLDTYNRMVEAMDRQIGEVLKALSATGQAEDTIVIFTSDNGGERFSNTWPFTGKKSELLEGGLRVPSVVRWPRHVPKGWVSEQTMMSMDWLPTLLAAAGSEPDSKYPSDGMNLLPVLTDGAAAVARKLFWRYKANGQRAMRDGDYKVLKIANNTFLFNVVEDPLERMNLKNRMPDLYKRLTQEWTAWNRTMLPLISESNTGAVSGDQMADHINSPRIDRRAVDDGEKWPTSEGGNPRRRRRPPPTSP